MSERPELDKNLDSETFRNHYYLKEELINFCRNHGLPTSGGKIEITERISHYLDTGEVQAAKTKTKAKPQITRITEEILIEPNFVCSEIHRAFFKEKLGPSFTFPVAFQRWLKENTGKTYAQALDAYRQIMADKKTGKTVIDKQFEYNTYIRDFFADNPGTALKDAIRCWKYKKGIRGHNRYERADLAALKP